jgi:hypothetical protein
VAKVKNLQTHNLQTLTANLFTRISYKINFSNKKGNQSLLAIDILKNEVQKDLLHISSQTLEKTYWELLSHKSPQQNVKLNGEKFFLQLLKETSDKFLVNQYGCDVCLDLDEFQNSFYIKNLLYDIDILFKVPFYALLNPKSADFLLIYYPVYNYASESFIEALLDNLVIEIANCVAYVSLINFSFLYSFRQTLYRSKFLSLRNFERFKNNLIWQLRIKFYINRPNFFYSSCYCLFLLRTTGISSRTIYANRSEHFNSLTNFPLFVVTLVELKDFILSRVDELLYFLSKAIRFTLTSVVGQLIGLIWRGVIEGLKK